LACMIFYVSENHEWFKKEMENKVVMEWIYKKNCMFWQSLFFQNFSAPQPRGWVVEIKVTESIAEILRSSRVEETVAYFFYTMLPMEEGRGLQGLLFICLSVGVSVCRSVPFCHLTLIPPRRVSSMSHFLSKTCLPLSKTCLLSSPLIISSVVPRSLRQFISSVYLSVCQSVPFCHLTPLPPRNFISLK
jgi:hypothetical protein